MTNNFNYSVGDTNYPPKKKNNITTSAAKNNFAEPLRASVLNPNGDITFTIPTATQEFDHTAIYTEPTVTRYDITGKRYKVPANASIHEQNQAVLGEDYVYNTSINVANSLIQGASITLTGGGSAAVAGTLARRQLIADVSLLAVKGVSQAIQYHEVGSGGHTYGWGKSFAMGFGGQVKFGNLGLFQKTFKKDGVLYDLAHTSHVWHHFSEHNSLQLLSLSPTKPYNVFGAQLQLNSLYTDFGFAQLEKQWLSASALYKGNFGMSSYWYEIRNGGGHNAATTGPLEHGEKGKEHKAQNEHQTNIEAHANAESTWLDKTKTALFVEDPDRNFVGKTVDIWRATEGYFNDAIVQNQKYKAYLNENQYNLIVNGTLGQKLQGVANIPGQVTENLLYSAANVVDFALGTVFGAVDVLATGFGDLTNVAYVSAQNWLDSGAPATKGIFLDDVETVNNANGTTTVTIKVKPRPKGEQSDIQRKQNETIRQLKNAEETKKKNENDTRLAVYKGGIQSAITANQKAANTAIYGTRGANMPVDYNKDPMYKSVFGATPGSPGSMKLPVVGTPNNRNTISRNFGGY